MIKCTLELCPGGVDDPETNEHLGTIKISNDIVGTVNTGGRRGNYRFDLWKKRYGSKINPARSGMIDGFPRLSYHPWNLVRLILEEAAYKNGGKI